MGDGRQAGSKAMKRRKQDYEARARTHSQQSTGNAFLLKVLRSSSNAFLLKVQDAFLLKVLIQSNQSSSFIAMP
jgi:hypothetical protein